MNPSRKRKADRGKARLAHVRDRDRDRFESSPLTDYVEAAGIAPSSDHVHFVTAVNGRATATAAGTPLRQGSDASPMNRPVRIAHGPGKAPSQPSPPSPAGKRLEQLRSGSKGFLGGLAIGLLFGLLVLLVLVVWRVLS